MICDMSKEGKEATRRFDATVHGFCAKCGEKVFESLSLLDDAYAVWWGKCPHCGALNCLSNSCGRGYNLTRMYLVLPTHEETIMNDLPAETPTRGWHDPKNQDLTKEQLIAKYP